MKKTHIFLRTICIVSCIYLLRIVAVYTVRLFFYSPLKMGLNFHLLLILACIRISHNMYGTNFCILTSHRCSGTNHLNGAKILFHSLISINRTILLCFYLQVHFWIYIYVDGSNELERESGRERHVDRFVGIPFLFFFLLSLSNARSVPINWVDCLDICCSCHRCWSCLFCVVCCCFFFFFHRSLTGES